MSRCSPPAASATRCTRPSRTTTSTSSSTTPAAPPGSSILRPPPSADPEETYTSLNEALTPEDLVSYDYSKAADANALVASATWAEENDVTAISDLATVDSVKLGADEDCRDRADCLVGYQDVYGIEVVVFVPPTLPMEATFPRRLAYSIIFPLAFLVLWGIGALTAAAIQDHRI